MAHTTGNRKRLLDVLHSTAPDAPTRWCSPCGSALVIYHTDGDYWTWNVPGDAGHSVMVEEVASAVRDYL